MDALTLQGVCHAYDGELAIDSIDLTVGEGKLVCLLGPSGCGKTTVLRVAAGLEPVQQGRVFIGESEVARPGASTPPEERGVGLVFQDYALFPHLTVTENVAFGLKGRPSVERLGTPKQMLDLVGLADLAERYPHTLSGGEQQRVALARALAPRPRLLLLDEPYTGLDIHLRNQVRDETLRVLRMAGISTMIVTHDPEEAMYMADHIAVMRGGRILQQGTPSELYNAPANAFIAKFLSDVNAMHGTVEGGKVPSIFGCLDANGAAEGVRVDVLIRPEALSLSSEGGRPATVAAVRLLGHSSIVTLAMDDDGSELRARVRGMDAPAEGDKVSLALDKLQSFVFPCADPTSDE
ncbi:MAG: ABC transporter ATP-binding protein [Alphaproteobacteria bacterium]